MPRVTNRSAESVRHALLDTAAELIAEKGVAALSVAEITRRLRVSGSTPYRFFAHREALLAASAARAGRQLAGDMRTAIAHLDDSTGSPSNAIEALAATAVAYVEFFAQYGAGFDFIFAEELTALHHADLIQARQEIMTTLLPLAAVVTGDSTSAPRLLEQYISAAHGLGALYIKGFAGRPPGSLQSVTDNAAEITRTLAMAATTVAV